MKWLGGAGLATEPFCHLVYLWAEHGAHYAALIQTLLQRWRKEERGDGTIQRRESVKDIERSLEGLDMIEGV